MAASPDIFRDIVEVRSPKFEGKLVKIRGWLHNKRSSGGIQFLLIRDGTGIAQSTLRKDRVDGGKYEEIEKLPTESALEIVGTVKRDTRAPGGFEISISKIEVLHRAEEEFPIAKKFHGPEFLLDHRHLWIRNEKMQAVLRVRAAFLDAAREWFRAHGYTEVQMPTLITAACEGGSTLFEVKYFDAKAYLSQSWQLYAEATIATLGRIFTIAPSFRAEKSRTRRHLTEYWHLEAEAPWCDLRCIMEVEEDLLVYACRTIGEEMKEELKTLGRNPRDLVRIDKPFKAITYDEAVQMLQTDGVDFNWGNDLGWEEEKRIASKFNSPLFVTHFPKVAKAFYHKLDPSRPEVTLSVDLLAPEGYGEITGGGQRIHSLDELLRRINEEGLNQKEYEWYIDLRRFGSVPHSGFGLGVERTVAWICRLEHIRDATVFPRLINRVYP